MELNDIYEILLKDRGLNVKDNAVFIGEDPVVLKGKRLVLSDGSVLPSDAVAFDPLTENLKTHASVGLSVLEKMLSADLELELYKVMRVALHAAIPSKKKVHLTFKMSLLLDRITGLITGKLKKPVDETTLVKLEKIYQAGMTEYPKLFRILHKDNENIGISEEKVVLRLISDVEHELKEALIHDVKMDKKTRDVLTITIRWIKEQFDDGVLGISSDSVAPGFVAYLKSVLNAKKVLEELKPSLVNIDPTYEVEFGCSITNDIFDDLHDYIGEVEATRNVAVSNVAEKKASLFSNEVVKPVTSEPQRETLPLTPMGHTPVVQPTIQPSPVPWGSPVPTQPAPVATSPTGLTPFIYNGATYYKDIQGNVFNQQMQLVNPPASTVPVQPTMNPYQPAPVQSTVVNLPDYDYSHNTQPSTHEKPSSVRNVDGMKW